jgi:hypothetical protein
MCGVGEGRVVDTELTRAWSHTRETHPDTPRGDVTLSEAFAAGRAIRIEQAGQALDEGRRIVQAGDQA